MLCGSLGGRRVWRMDTYICMAESFHCSPGNYCNIVNQLSVQFSSVAQSCPTLCDPMNRIMPGLPVHHQLLEFTQTHVHRVSDANPAISSSVVPFSSCPQSLPASESFQWVNSLHEVAKVLEFQLQHHSYSNIKLKRKRCTLNYHVKPFCEKEKNPKRKRPQAGQQKSYILSRDFS